MQLELSTLVNDFAQCLMVVDSQQPQATSIRSKETYAPGIGAFPEAQAVALVAKALAKTRPTQYLDRLALNVGYPTAPRQRCDLCIGTPENWDWVIEIKMLRFLGNNGKLNDNILMHILSPYPKHRSALTDSLKLARSGFRARKALLVYGFDYEDWPLEPAITALEILASAHVKLSRRTSAQISGLVHPVHTRGSVSAWEILS